MIQTLIDLPTAEQWPLIKPLIMLMKAFFLPFMGLVIVSAAVSVAFRLLGRSRTQSQDLIDLGLGVPGAWMVFGLLPIVSMVFLYSQYLYDQPIEIAAYMSRILGLVVVGLVFLLLYRRTLKPVLGGVGVLASLGGLYHFVATVSLIAVPERWEMVELPLPFFHSYQPLVHMNILLASAFLFTGSSLLVAFFHWSERKLLTPSHERSEVRTLAYVLLVLGLLPLPALLVLDFAIAPFFTLRPDVFSLPFWMLVVFLVLGILVIRMVAGRHTRHSWPAFALSLLFVWMFAGRQQSQISVGNQEHDLAVSRRVEENRAELVAEREELYAAAAELPEDAGEQLFNRVCSSCHAFDREIVGPSYNAVLGKYVDDLEGLAQFIHQPARVNTDYPAMPNQGLRRVEARAVAEYLLTRFTGEPVGGGAEEGGESGETGSATTSSAAARSSLGGVGR